MTAQEKRIVDTVHNLANLSAADHYQRAVAIAAGRVSYDERGIVQCLRVLLELGFAQAKAAGLPYRDGAR